MNQIHSSHFLSLFLLLGASFLHAQAPVISAVAPVSSQVEQYSKFEVAITLTAAFTNPYDYENIQVGAVFTGPNGQSKAVDGFYMQGYQLNTQSGDLSPSGNPGFKIRFAPDQPGNWKYTVSCTNALGTGTFPEQNFTCSAASSATNKGYVRSGPSNYLHFDDGEQYIPMGENIAWQSSNVYLDYKNWLGDLSQNGGNYFRLWHCSWGLGIEWKNNSNGYQGLRKYKQTNAAYQDWMFDYCMEKGIYVMLCLHHHGQVSSQVNPNWGDSPYNAVNGGPCTNTWDFFTNQTAKKTVKNRLRYVVARWGYARSIQSWELFNEVDWTDQFEAKKNDVFAWHYEMAAFLHDIDPYQHLVTTSYAQDQYDPGLWITPVIDFTQTHYYVGTSNLERVLAKGERTYLNDFEKPTINGEFGLSGDGSGLATLDPSGIYLHNSLWGSLFGGGMGAGASWWWDNYVEPKNLYYHFQPLATVIAQLPLLSAGMKPTPFPASVSGVPADLILTPTLGWGALADTTFLISGGNVVIPGADLSQFLYGSSWNTQFKRAPIFDVFYQAAGPFSVLTSNASGTSPKITIWVDGVQVLQQNAQTNQTYTVNIAAGTHKIKVDNTGTDWISIAGYKFGGLGSALDAYVLMSADMDKMAGWVLNNRYNHEYIPANGQPPVASGGVLKAIFLKNGTYQVRYFNCENGSLISLDTVTVTNDQLQLHLPDIQWDMAFLLEDISTAVHENAVQIPLSLYPNPLSGSTLHLDFETAQSGSTTIDMLDANGRSVSALYNAVLPAGMQQLNLQVSDVLPNGVYWIRVITGGKTGIKLLVINRN